MDATDLYIGVRDLNLDVQGKINTEDLDLKAKLVHLGYGNWTLTLPREHEMAELLRTPGSGIIVQQKVSGTWETKFSGPTTSPSTKRTPEDPNGLLTVQGTDDNILLWDTLAWGDPTNVLTAQATSNDVRTGPAETVMKQYVDYNLGPSALSARRGALAQLLTIETNGATGPTVSKSPRFQNLGELLAEIALYADMGFRIVQVGNGLVFETYSISDRTGIVRFDIESGTLTEETLAISPPGVTRTIVAGQGEGIERTLIQRTTTDSLSAEGDWGRSIEKWVDQRNTDDTDELNQAGDEPLIASGFTGVAVKAVPADAHTMKFGPDWGLGDLVRVVVEGAEEAALITEVAIVANSAGVEIGAAIGDVSSFAVSTNLQSQVSSVSNRVSALERSTGAGYIYTDAATPNTIVRRDAAGRAKVATPAVDADIATRGYVNTSVSSAVDAALLTTVVGIKKTIYTSGSGTWNRDSKCLFALVEGVGAGAGGTTPQDTSSGQIAGGNGGGGGGYFRFFATAAELSSSQAYSVGAAGGAGSGGGNTTFGSLGTAGGGGASGGRGPTTGGFTTGGVAGEGGTASSSISGAVLIPGERGGGAFGTMTSSLRICQGGAGGSSALGSGGRGGGANASSNVYGDGEQGEGLGGGGGGGVNIDGATAAVGAAGKAGILVITEFLGN